jgi:hypothetical protein
MLDFGPRYRGPYRCLSLDLYAYGQPLLVAPGRYSYEAEGVRLFNPTRYQNTVSINEANQSPNPKQGLGRSKIGGQMKLLHAWHDGYSHLASHPEGEGRIIHERQVLMIRNRCWIVADLVRVDGDREFTFDQNWRFMPTELSRPETFPNAVVSRYESSNVAIVPLVGDGRIHEESSWFSPRYNVKFPAPRISYRHVSREGWFVVTLLVPFPGAEVPLRQIDVNTDGPRSMVSRLLWSDGYEDRIALSFGEAIGGGAASWQGSHAGIVLGEEAF